MLESPSMLREGQGSPVAGSVPRPRRPDSPHLLLGALLNGPGPRSLQTLLMSWLLPQRVSRAGEEAAVTGDETRAFGSLSTKRWFGRGPARRAPARSPPPCAVLWRSGPWEPRCPRNRCPASFLSSPGILATLPVLPQWKRRAEILLMASLNSLSDRLGGEKDERESIMQTWEQ